MHIQLRIHDFTPTLHVSAADSHHQEAKIQLIRLPNEKIKGGKYKSRKIFWYSNLSILHTLFAEDGFSWHPISLKNYTPPRFLQCSKNQTTMAHHEAEGEEPKLTRKTNILRTEL